MLRTIPEKISNTDTDLEITWKDGTECRFSLLMLRKCCPCAVCRGGHDANSVRITGQITDIRLVSTKKVGRYAVSFTWSDNHDTGIYTFDNLRAACDEKRDYL